MRPHDPSITTADINADPLTMLMTMGGDERIWLNPDTGFNRYLTAPRPHFGIALSSSTANFISAPAMAHIRQQIANGALATAMTGADYAHALDRVRSRLRKSWQLPTATQIVFAASGTDLEYVGLATALRPDAHGVDNVLLGVDEIGSGCIHSAAARHYASVTPLGHDVQPGQTVDGTLAASTRLIEIAVRDSAGRPRTSAHIETLIAEAAHAAIAEGRRPLIHIVHGSKTGLILPSLAHIDALRRTFGSAISFVVDACQTRISREMVAAYLARDCWIFLTGSKFVGGPPFSGFALIPSGTAQQASELPSGFASVFARAEWPQDWPGQQHLPDVANVGLLLRLEASVFEIERYHRLDSCEIERVVTHFEAAMTRLKARLGVSRVGALANQGERDYVPLELRTLVALDLSPISAAADLECSRRLYESLAGSGADEDGQPQLSIRLGQPVRCIKRAEGGYGANIRIALSMPQIVSFAAMDDRMLERHLKVDMACIADRIERFYRKGIDVVPA